LLKDGAALAEQGFADFPSFVVLPFGGKRL
jgi:hypothetical protein